MKYLLLIFSIIITGCSSCKEEKKENPILSSKDIELVRCICVKYELLLNEVVRNNEKINFTCRTKKHDIISLYVWDNTYVEGCSK